MDGISKTVFDELKNKIVDKKLTEQELISEKTALCGISSQSEVAKKAINAITMEDLIEFARSVTATFIQEAMK